MTLKSNYAKKSSFLLLEDFFQKPGFKNHISSLIIVYEVNSFFKLKSKIKFGKTKTLILYIFTFNVLRANLALELLVINGALDPCFFLF